MANVPELRLCFLFCSSRHANENLGLFCVCTLALQMKVFQENSPEKIAKNELALQQVKVSHVLGARAWDLVR